MRKGDGVTGNEVVYTVNEVAKLLRLHPLTVRRGIERGEIPSIKVGRRVLIPRKIFEDFLAGSNGHPVDGAGTQTRAAGRGGR